MSRFSSSKDRHGLQALPGRQKPDKSALIIAGVLPDQTCPEGPEVSTAPEGAGVSDTASES